jgi:hypothetical protein
MSSSVIKILKWKEGNWIRDKATQVNELEYSCREDIMHDMEKVENMYFPCLEDITWLEARKSSKFKIKFEAEYLGNEDGHTWRIWAELPSIGRVDLGIECAIDGQCAIEYHLEHMANVLHESEVKS